MQTSFYHQQAMWILFVTFVENHSPNITYILINHKGSTTLCALQNPELVREEIQNDKINTILVYQYIIVFFDANSYNKEPKLNQG